MRQFEQSLAPPDSGPWEGNLRIGTLGYLDAELWDTCQALMYEHEHLTLQLAMYPSLEQLTELLLTGVLDLALVPAPLHHPRLESQAYGHSPMVAVAAPHIPFQAGYLRCLAPEPLHFYLELPPGFLPQQALGEIEMAPAIALGVAGAGALWLPYGAVHHEIEKGQLQRLRRPAFQRSVPLYLTWATTHDPYPLLVKFLQVLRPHAIPL